MIFRSVAFSKRFLVFWRKLTPVWHWRTCNLVVFFNWAALIVHFFIWYLWTLIVASHWWKLQKYKILQNNETSSKRMNLSHQIWLWYLFSFFRSWTDNCFYTIMYHCRLDFVLRTLFERSILRKRRCRRASENESLFLFNNHCWFFCI